MRTGYTDMSLEDVLRMNFMIGYNQIIKIKHNNYPSHILDKLKAEYGDKVRFVQANELKEGEWSVAI